MVDPVPSGDPKGVARAQGEPRERDTWLWELRVSAILPLPPWAVAAGVALLLFAVYLAGTALAGQPVWEEPSDPPLANARQARFALVLSLLLGLILATFRTVAVAGFRIRQSLGFERREVDPARELDRALPLPREIARRSRVGSVLGGVLGAALVGAVVALDAPALGVPLLSLYADMFLDFGAVYTALLTVALLSVAGRAAYLTLGDALSIPGFVERELPVDLLDLAPVLAYGRLALAYALVWVVVLSVAALLVGLAPPPVLADTAWTLAVPVAALAIPALAFFLPVRGVHRRLRAEKEAELARIDAALRGDLGALAQSRIARRAGEASLADLLLYRSHVDGIREWPFDESTLRRFALYLLIPLGSWLGGALVERVVDAALD